MSHTLTIVAGQTNSTVGDIVGNTQKLVDGWKIAKIENATVFVDKEMGILGYNAEDLVLKPDVQAECADAIKYFVAATRDGPDSIIGAPIVENGVVYNAAIHCGGGKIKQIIKKHDLPNFGVFDDKRVFGAGEDQEPITLNGVKVGVMVCEDAWHEEVARRLVERGVEILIVINASPYEYGKETHARMDAIRDRVKETGVPIIYVNQVGGQDGVVYDGHSLAVNRNLSVGWRAPGWVEHFGVINCTKHESGWVVSGDKAPWGDGDEQLYSALVLGTRDYIRKNGFKKVIIGASGGADSSLVAAIAVDAVGAENVNLVRLPSALSSQHSMDDAEELAQRLGCKLTTLPVMGSVKMVGESLVNYFGDSMQDIAEQNIQARLRGLFLMAITNQYPAYLLLTTGNKSELAVGYATLYGDMSGGLAVISDVYKSAVFQLMRYRNSHKPTIALGPSGLVIPINAITKPPSAELKANQVDANDLGDYVTQLDPVLKQLIEKETPIQDIVAMGFDPAYVAKISNMLDRNEFKRHQAAPGIKVTSRALRGDRRYPVTNGFRSSRRIGHTFIERVTQCAPQ
jgi:NAD+ synthase